MYGGALFGWLFLVVASGVAAGLLWRGIRRAIREPRIRWKILGATAGALVMWWLASDTTFDQVFFVMWGLAHTRPLPDGLFPEGWQIYAWLAGCAALGTALVVGLAKLPRGV
jgi:hypothetical protein